MKNLGIGGRNNTHTRAPRYGFTTMPILWRCGEPSRKWICVQPPAHFLISPGVRPEFIEDGYADDADVLGVVIFLSSVRFANGSETKRRNRFSALPKTFHDELRSGRHHVTGFAK